MFDTDIIGVWDYRAASLAKEEGNKNVFEFDLTLWSLLSSLAKERPADAVSQFGLSQKAIGQLAAAKPEQLRVLASGVIIAFKLETSEEAIISKLADAYDPVVLINRKVGDFDAAYWLLLNRMAAKDVEVAKESFGVSLRLLEAVAKATDSQLRHLASTTVTRFSLRFASLIIEEVLLGDRGDVTYPVLKKLQQSLSFQGWRWK